MHANHCGKVRRDAMVPTNKINKALLARKKEGVVEASTDFGLWVVVQRHRGKERRLN